MGMGMGMPGNMMMGGHPGQNMMMGPGGGMMGGPMDPHGGMVNMNQQQQHSVPQLMPPQQGPMQPNNAPIQQQVAAVKAPGGGGNSTMEAQYMQQQSQIFVFSTSLANKAADSVQQGQFQTIIACHCSQEGTKKLLQVTIYI